MISTGDYSTQVSEWVVQGNEVRRYYRITPSSGAEPVVFEIHCTLSKGLLGLSIDMLVHLLFLPGLIEKEASVKASLAATDDASPEFFSALARPANDGSTVMAVMGTQDVNKCFKLFASGKNMVFRLLSDAQQLKAQLFLPNDDGFRKAYDLCYKNAEATPRARNVFDDVLEETFGLREKQPTEKFKKEATEESAPLDLAEVRRNSKEYVVCMYELNPGEYTVWLAKLDDKGKMIDAWGLETLPNRAEQSAFARDVARDLRVKIVDMVPRDPD